MAIPIDGLAEAVAQELREYSAEVAEDLKTSVRSASKACVATLKQTSPKDTGGYADGWKARKAYENSSELRMEVHNSTHHQLTHLLEDGHAKVGGGRVSGKPHIQPAADQAAELLEKDAKLKVGVR